MMDRTRISQVVTNLLENVIGHTPEGGTVSLTAESGSPNIARIFELPLTSVNS